MTSPHRRCHPQQNEEDKSVMKVTVVSCKGERPSESVINVHIDGINPNANSPQIDKFMRRLTKNVVKIQNELENQNNPHRLPIDPANPIQPDSGGGPHAIKATVGGQGNQPVSPPCPYQNKVLHTEEVVQDKLRNVDTRVKVKNNASVKGTNSKTDIVEIYSNKLINQSCDSVFLDEWTKRDSVDANPIPVPQPCSRKRSLSCNNIAVQRGNPVQVYQVNQPGSSRPKDDDEVGQEDTETDDISISTVSLEDKSSCSCCNQYFSALNTTAEEMQLANSSNTTTIMTGKSSNGSAFKKCCGSPNKKRTVKTPTEKKKAGKTATKGKNKASTEEGSSATDTSQYSNSESGNSNVSKIPENTKRDDLAEKELSEKQMATDELRRKTEEQNKRIEELNRKLDELFRRNNELNRANTQDTHRMEDERRREIERREAEYARRLESNYPGEGKNRRVRVISKGDRTNIEAIEALLHNKLPSDPAPRNVPPRARRWDEYPPNRPQPIQPQGPPARGPRFNDSRAPPYDNYYRTDRDGAQSNSPYSYNDPKLDYYDRPRGPSNFESQPQRPQYDPNLDYYDRPLGPSNLDPSGRSRRPDYDFPRDRDQGIDYIGARPPPSEQPRNAPIPAEECDVCNSSDQDVTFCCCFKKRAKSKGRSRPASPQRPCQCCGQCPPNCICENGDQTPLTLYQNAVLVPNTPELIGDEIFPSQALKSKENTALDDGVAEINHLDVKAMSNTEIGTNNHQTTLVKQKESKQNVNFSEGLSHKHSGDDLGRSKSLGNVLTSKSSGNVLQSISASNLGQAKSTELHVGDGADLEMVHFDSDVHEEAPMSPEEMRPDLTPQDNKDKKERFVQQMLGCDCAHKGDGPAPEGIRPDGSPQDDKDKKERFVQQMLGCDCAHKGDGTFSAQVIEPKDKICPVNGAAEDNVVVAQRDKKSGMPRKQRNFFKYLCACCNCKDSQESMVNAEGTLKCVSGECLAKSKSVGNVVSRTGLDLAQSKTSSVAAKTSLQIISCGCDGQEGAQQSPDGVQISVDPQHDTEKKEQFVKQMLGCDCEGPTNGQTVQEKFADESKKEQLVKQMMSCACNESKIEVFPSEELISFENYEDQYFDDANGMDALPKRGPRGSHTRGEHHADENVGAGLPRNCACEGGQQPRDLDGKQNVVERRLDRHGFGDRRDCEKKRKLVRTRLGCVCSSEETDETFRKQRFLENRLRCQRQRVGDPQKMRDYVSSGLSCMCSSDEAGEALRKQRLVEDRLGCSHQPIGDPRKMREYVRSGLGCGVQCDEHVVREARRKQAIVERRLNCTANHLRDTDKKSAYLKRRLDCICDDADTQAKKQQAYLERFLTCGCTNVARDLQKKKQFVDDFLKCKCDKESEAKKMQMYLERYLSCDCEHTKERNMDKKIDYMNKVMSCDGPDCKAEKEGKELVTVCGDGTVDVAEVTRRLPATAPSLGSDSLLCCCGSGDSYLGPCRCDSMTDVEKSSGRRHRLRAPSSVVGGLICRCGKEGDSECVCDGADLSTPKPHANSLQSGTKRKCKCRHRLDGICRCRGKTGPEDHKAPNARRQYLVNQVPCDKTAGGAIESVSDPILCSAKRDECICEQDPESCFCSESSKAKPDVTRKEEVVRSDNRKMSDTSNSNLPQTDEEENDSEEKQGEEDKESDENQDEEENDSKENQDKDENESEENQDEADNQSEENQDEAENESEVSQDETDQDKDEFKDSQIGEIEAAVKDGCVCKKNCSGKCKCDIDGSDCSQGQQARRCYCDLEGPETCICAKAARWPVEQSPSQGTCYCTKDEEGLCKCDFTSEVHQKSRCKAQAKGTCHCRKDKSGRCKCDKGKKSKQSSEHGVRHSEIVIELRNMDTKPKVRKSVLEQKEDVLSMDVKPTVRKSDLEQKEEISKVKSSSSIDDENAVASQHTLQGHETQVHYMETDANDLFVLKAPHVEEFSSELESNDESASVNNFMSPDTSDSGAEFVSSPSTTESADKFVSSQNSSENNNLVVYPPHTTASAGDLENSLKASNSGTMLPQPLNKTESSVFNLGQSSELPQDTKDGASVLPTVAAVDKHGTQSGTSATELTIGQAGPSTADQETVQGGSSAVNLRATRVGQATTGRSGISTDNRRPKWYHMFQRRKRESEDDSGHSADLDDCS